MSTLCGEPRSRDYDRCSSTPQTSEIRAGAASKFTMEDRHRAIPCCEGSISKHRNSIQINDEKEDKYVRNKWRKKGIG